MNISVLDEAKEKIKQAGETGNPKLAIDAFCMLLAPSDPTTKTTVPVEVYQKELAEAESVVDVWLDQFIYTCEYASLLIRRKILLENPKVKPADVPPFPKESYNLVEKCQWFVDAECYLCKPTVAAGEWKSEDAVPVKRWGIKRIPGWIFKKTSHFILTVIVTIFATVIAAIVVDIFADFGWLQSIKAFIYSIWWPK